MRGRVDRRHVDAQELGANRAAAEVHGSRSNPGGTRGARAGRAARGAARRIRDALGGSPLRAVGICRGLPELGPATGNRRRRPRHPGAREREDRGAHSVCRRPDARRDPTSSTATRMSARRSASPTMRWRCSASVRISTRGGARRKLGETLDLSDHASAPDFAGIHFSSPSSCSYSPRWWIRHDDHRPRRRPDLVPDRRRQDRGLPRRSPPSPIFLRRLRHWDARRRNRRAHPLHAAPADRAAVPARGRDSLRLEVSAPARRRMLGEEPISIGLWVGEAARPQQVRRGGRAVQ